MFRSVFFLGVITGLTLLGSDAFGANRVVIVGCEPDNKLGLVVSSINPPEANGGAIGLDCAIVIEQFIDNGLTIKNTTGPSDATIVYTLTGFDFPSCGDGLAEGTEVCDGTDLRGQSCETQGFTSGTLACLADCSDFDVSDCTNPFCGDGVVDSGEECDDGGNSSSCDSDCTAAVCGDLFVNTNAGEQCDDGGTTFSCDGDCTSPVCGDGFLNTAAGEQCDDGNLTNGDGCDAQCLTE